MLIFKAISILFWYKCTNFRGTERQFQETFCPGQLLTDTVHVYTCTEIFWRSYFNVFIMIVHLVAVTNGVLQSAGVCVFNDVFGFYRINGDKRRRG